MAYGKGEFEADALKVARVLHLSYRRCEYLLDRWYGGMNTQFPSNEHPALNNLMSRVAEKVADYDAGGSAKLNTVLAVSDLQLPGDE